MTKQIQIDPKREGLTLVHMNTAEQYVIRITDMAKYRCREFIVIKYCRLKTGSLILREVLQTTQCSKMAKSYSL